MGEAKRRNGRPQSWQHQADALVADFERRTGRKLMGGEPIDSRRKLGMLRELLAHMEAAGPPPDDGPGITLYQERQDGGEGLSYARDA